MSELAGRNPQFADLHALLSKDTNFCNAEGTLPSGYFDKGAAVDNLNARILVIGAGGIGSEHLKNLALSGIKNIDVVDMDTIDLTNLNRQFLFRMKDIGNGKAETAANFVMSRVPGCNIQYHTKRIQEMDDAFYRQFKVVVCGLDNLPARRWMNAKLHELVQRHPPGTLDDEGNDISNSIIPESIIPMIDGGTEAFKGQCQVFIPFCGSCYECTSSLNTPQVKYQLCTLASKPRLPEHCIAWVTQLHWDKVASKLLENGKTLQVEPGESPDYDDPDQVQWIYEQALARAKEYKIEGVTYFKTLGVAKNVIPAVASTNAIISASCCNEVLKLLTFRGHTLNNSLHFNGEEGVSAACNWVERVSECIVCSEEVSRNFEVPSDITVIDFIVKYLQDGSLSLSKEADSSDLPKNIVLSMIYKYGFNNGEWHSNLVKPLRRFLEGKPGKDVQINGSTYYALSVYDYTITKKTININVRFIEEEEPRASLSCGGGRP